MEIESLARSLGGGPADIPGLWWIPGYPELTTSQLLSVANSPTDGSLTAREIANLVTGIPGPASHQ